MSKIEIVNPDGRAEMVDPNVQQRGPVRDELAELMKDEPRVFTEQEVEEIVHNRIAREAKRGTGANPDRGGGDRDSADRRFDRGVARASVALSEGQEEMLRAAYLAENPSIPPGEWITAKATALGIGKPIAAAGTAPNRVGRIDSGQFIDVSTLTPEEVGKLGPHGVREQLERVVTAGQARDGRPFLPAVLREQAAAKARNRGR
jgi:hypothetical protein